MNESRLTRRKLLKAMFYGAATTTLYACGGGANRAAEELLAPTGSDTGAGSGAGDTLGALARELPLKPGPLADIGPLQTSDVDGILIPEGFSIRRVAAHLTDPVSGNADPLGATSYPWHAFPDGGAVFKTPDNGWVYVSNSEVDTGGGVGALRFDSAGTVTDAYRILDNTRRNCAGGASPWGTWLSCEETPDGLVYECDPVGNPTTAQSLPALGLFNHEAVAVDLESRTLFLTEDADDGRLYRFRSAGETVSINGQTGLDMTRGTLEVLEIEGFENGGYQTDLTTARLLSRVTWKEVQSPERPQATVRSEIETTTGMGAPGTVFRGGEGIWLQSFPAGDRPLVEGTTNPLRAVVFFACKGDNRVYALDLDNDLIEVVFDNEQLMAETTPFDDVDNLVVGPAGDVVVSEDGDAMRLMVMIPNQPSKILLQIPGGGSELTGPAFTDDGSRLYFSSQRGGESATGVTYELTIPPEFRS